ncbi:unnamed protein product, partial [Polarella glacialis]
PFSVPNLSMFATSSKFPSTVDADKGRSAATHLAALTTGVAAVQRLRRARRGGKSTLNAEPDRGFRILEWASSAMGGQKSLVKVARWGSREAWRTMVKELAPQSPSGDYLRPASQLKAETGSKLTLIDGGHAVYVGNTCPWCHRIQLALVLRRVPENLVARVQMLDEPERASRGGWAFDPARGVSDPVFDAADLREVYDRAAGGEGKGYVGRCTAPLLVDRSTGRAVSNDSIQLVRFITTARLASDREVDLFPGGLESTIEETNRWTYELLSNAVYRAGFSTSQEAFARAAEDVTRGLDRANELLASQRFLCGDHITEADVMLLPCAARFDAVYAFLFLRGSCGLWREREHLRRWLRDCWSLPGVRETVDVRACQQSYYGTLFPLNPSQIVPVPAADPDALGPAEELSISEAEACFHWKKATE